MTLKDLEKHKNQKDKLLITQLTMTNNPTCGNICKWICGMKTAQVNVMTTALKNNPEFPKFLYKAIDHRDLNVVTLDFVAEKPEYCQFIISSNYEIDLKLHAVFWNGLPVDYTLLEKFIHNKNTLFLTNAKEELKKLGIMGPDEKEGTLLIGYSYLPLHDVFVTECFKETNFRGYKLCSHNDMVLITNFKNEFNDHNYDKGHYGNVWGFVNHREITEV